MSDDKKSKEIESTKESTLYYFTSTGCAFCKKVEPIIERLNSSGNYNILKLDISDSNNKGLKAELEKEYDVKCGTPWFIDAETGNGFCGNRDEATIKKWANGEKIPVLPKPTGPPPKPPVDFNNEEQVNTWKNEYKKWATENKNLPNVPPVDDMFNRLKHQQEISRKRMNQNPNPNLNVPKREELKHRIDNVEKKLDKLLNHLGIK